MKHYLTGKKGVTAFAYTIRKIFWLREIFWGFQERFFAMNLATYLLNLLKLGIESIMAHLIVLSKHVSIKYE
jgi:hypothetical protein